jgi:GT2 family glycosyltransferase
MVAAMAADPATGMAGCLVKNPDGTEQVACRRSIPTPWRSVIRILHLKKLFPRLSLFKGFDLRYQPLPTTPTYVEAISGAFMFAKRTALNEVGLLDPGYFLHCEDMDWFMRFHQSGWKILFVPNVVITHIKGACSQKEPIKVLWHKHKSMVRFYRKFFLKKYPRILLLPVVISVWLRFTLLSLLITAKRLSSSNVNTL